MPTVGRNRAREGSEDVPDDRAALQELCRALSPTGVAVLQVPVLAERTDEDPQVTDPAERLRRFGQADHVRVYGPDVYDRMTSAGFSVERVDLRELTTPEERIRFGLRHQPPWVGGDAAALWRLPLRRRGEDGA